MLSSSSRTSSLDFLFLPFSLAFLSNPAVADLHGLDTVLGHRGQVADRLVCLFHQLKN